MKISWHATEINNSNDLKLSDFKTRSGLKEPDKKTLIKLLEADTSAISVLQYRMYAENRQSLLIILQGMDSAGKDGTIKHIMSGVNPQGVGVCSFKHPSSEELEHDYLWRHYQKLPRRGQIMIFNRSHYENVLISRVHPELVLAERLPGILSTNDINHDFWITRYRQINDFEKTIIENGTCVLKFFLHLSRKEQRSRFLERIKNKEKHWKFSSNDIRERTFWEKYIHAYQTAIRHTSSHSSPWYIIPADDKWYAHLMVGKIILETLKKMHPDFPKMDKQEEQLINKGKIQLMNEEKTSK
ncbi:MAG TPA: PPK2 family polyphosphate kinase [Chitinophagaceae bacterium]|nr:PPK2 family polyphosphate kinase [Chitinophagaceae bacterium]